MSAIFNEQTIIGYVLAALVLIASFAAVILKISKPLQDLNTNIVKLTTVMSFIGKEQDSLREVTKKHTEALEELHTQLAITTTRIDNFEKGVLDHANYKT